MGVAANALREDPLPWGQEWSTRVETLAIELGIRVADVEEAEALLGAGTWYVFDARAQEVYAEGHLPLALSLPRDRFEDAFLEHGAMLVPEQEILVYCSGTACDESLDVCRYLQEQGFTNLVLFTGGYEAWSAAGLPTEEGG